MTIETINYPDGSKYVGSFTGWKVHNGKMFDKHGREKYIFVDGSASSGKHSYEDTSVASFLQGTLPSTSDDAS